MAIKVLAIDDSYTIREMLRTALSEAGFQIELAFDGLDGLAKLNECRPDVVVTDINMPRMDGFSFLRAVRSGGQHPALPILVLTTEGATDMKNRARDEGATAWIVKPFDRKKLISAIKRVTVE
tara:strand:- start:18 stop:386 length:369 start_codon:yes stop_codon:yes gene_type:complete